MIADLVEVVGDTQFVSVTLGRGSAYAEALTGPEAKTTDDFYWRDGKAGRDGPTSSQPTRKGLADSLFDVATVDWTLMEGLAAQVPELVGRNTSDFSVTVELADSEPSVVQFDIYVPSNYPGSGESAWIVADATGRIVSMRGGDPGSPVATWKTEGFFALAPGVVDDFAAAAGTNQFRETSFNEYGARAKVMTTLGAGATAWDRFDWDDGIVSHSDGGTGGSGGSFDVTAVDWTLVGKLAAQVPDLTQVMVGSLKVEIRPPDSDSEQRVSTPVVFVLGVNSSNSSEYESTIVADATGKIVWMQGGAPGSPADLWAGEHL